MASTVLSVAGQAHAEDHYVFSAEKLQSVAKSVQSIAPDDRFDAIENELDAYAPHTIRRDATWTFNMVGTALAEIKILYCTPSEYVALWGTPVGTDGFSGRYHFMDVWDVMFDGELLQFRPGTHTAERYVGGDVAPLPRGIAKGYKIPDRGYMIDYGRGNVLSAFPTGVVAPARFVTRDFDAAKDQFMDCAKSATASILRRVRGGGE